MPCWHRTPQSCQPCPPISPKLTWSVWVLRASPQTQQDRPSAPRASPTARRAQGHPKKVRDAESWCWNPPSSPVLQDFCASSFGKVWELPRSNGARAHLCSQRSGDPASPIRPSCSQHKTSPEASPEGRKGFRLHFHFAQNMALLPSKGNCPSAARWMLPGNRNKTPQRQHCSSRNKESLLQLCPEVQGSWS